MLFNLEKHIKVKTNALNLAFKAIISQPNKDNK
jgi:hypothetical protein